eukprot:CAMPEP_0183305146 /NCGR_PEP_ID=MMETSP0160_2-20130417/9988_1 /TAXON_ID=2839 ORGANISM="Odontella Sinensis, Strain Grunow 1884" /NCGR_SAMPLE_ID=MMETSP0160_2 /ASSEMBLY_ACC=CAM_ASM_000250 /LENGTH=88 /DNA_ID=CAMNT_0025468307 /DNA_START=143 /DNA_END=406 /DNA_ORIENTATION=+
MNALCDSANPDLFSADQLMFLDRVEPSLLRANSETPPSDFYLLQFQDHQAQQQQHQQRQHQHQHQQAAALLGGADKLNPDKGPDLEGP